MRTLEKIVLHPRLENESREEVRDWCNIAMQEGEWWVNSNYTEHGCFNVTITGEHNESFVTAFMIKYPETLIVESDYKEIWESDPASLVLFEGLE
jgi:hypothetical protein